MDCRISSPKSANTELLSWFATIYDKNAFFSSATTRRTSSGTWITRNYCHKYYQINN